MSACLRIRNGWIAVWLLIASHPAPLAAEDWYRWRGPRLNGVSSESNWKADWREKPPILWRKNVGVGFSSVTIANHRAYTMGNTDNQDTVFCLNADSGEILWTHCYEAALDDRFFEGGPTSTPTIDGQRVYTLSRQGQLFCFQAETGRIVWRIDLVEQTKVRIPGWGFSCSPLVVGSQLILNVGEAGASVDKNTGRVIWTSADQEAGYASPVPYRAEEQDFAVVASGKYFFGVNLASGKERWRQRWLTQFGANAADPIIRWPYVFLSSGYNRGSALLRLDGPEPAVVWKSKEMQNQMNASVLLGDYLYGIDGAAKAETALKCLHWMSGEVKWSQSGFGAGSLMAADKRLIILSEQGELVVARASPARFEALSRAPVLTGKCWTVPTLAQGRIYCRNADGDVVCLDAR